MEIKYTSLEEIKKNLKTNKSKLVCIGAGNLFKEYFVDLSEQIYCIADNKKSGQIIKYCNKNFDIILPQKIGLLPEVNNCIIVVTTMYYKEIVEELLENNNANFVIHIPYDILGFNVRNSENAIEWKERRLYKACELMQTHLVDVCESDEKRNIEMKDRLSRDIREKRVVLPKVCFLATTRCTLNCKGCIGMIDKMEDQIDFSLEVIKRDIDKLLSLVDRVITVEISGGEPFIYKYFDELLEYMLGQEKINSIIIPTNATILPKENRLKLLRHPKVSLHISDYGNLVQMANFIDLLEKNDIRFHFMTNQFWVDPENDLGVRNKTYEQLCVDYQNCSNGLLCKTVFDGRLYHCARAARYYWLTKDEITKEKDSLCILDKEITEKDIEKFFLSEVCYACDACSLTSIGAKKIEAGRQKGDHYCRKSRYTLCKRE